MDSESPRWRYRWLTALLILGTAGGRLAYLISGNALDLAPDEAHYWDWSRHLDWSYYSKGPLIAWLIRGSCILFGGLSLHLVGTEALAVRLPAIVFGSLLLTGMYVLTARIFRREGLALAVVALALTVPVIHVGAILMTIDAPFTCCWCWALVAVHEAVLVGRRWAWPTLGLLIGLGILAKYTMVLFVPLLACFLWQTRGWQAVWRLRGFWVMGLIATLCCLPIILWNAQHGWVTLRHTQGHAGLQSRTAIHWLGPLTFLGGQFALLLGYWLIVWAAAAWAHRPWRETKPEMLFLWWLSAPIFAFFMAFSLKNGGGEPNWPIPAYLGGMVLAAGWLANSLKAASLWPRRMILGIIGAICGLGILTSLLVHRSDLLTPMLARIAGPETEQHPLPMRRFDPTARLKGWRTLAAAIDKLRGQLEARGLAPVLAASSWSIPGELGFYCQGQPTVYCLGPLLGERHSQYDLWRPNPVDDARQFQNDSFILVGISAEAALTWFDQVESSTLVVHQDQGHAVAAWAVTVARGYRGGPNLSEGRGF